MKEIESNIREIKLISNSFSGFLRRTGQRHLLYKPVQFGSKGVREVSFYDALYGVSTHLGDPSIFPSLCRSSNNSLLQSILPMYHGLTTIADRAGQKCKRERERVCVCVACEYYVYCCVVNREYHECLITIVIHNEPNVV